MHSEHFRIVTVNNERPLAPLGTRLSPSDTAPPEYRESPSPKEVAATYPSDEEGPPRVNRNERNALVVENLPLVGYLVSDLCSRATHLSRDDLASAGSVALVQAADAYDATTGVPFGAYARTRIVGALADELRATDWATRGARKRIKETLAVQESLSSSLGRAPSVDEIANALGVDRETAAAGLADASRTVSALDETIEPLLVSDTMGPAESLLADEQTAYVRAAVAALPDRMRSIVEAIYFDDRTVTEVAEELGITHSAVSQQRSEAIRLMREGMATHYSDEGDPVIIEAKTSQARRSAYLARLAQHAVAGVSRLSPTSPSSARAS
jgi:RNA polymerase sigma factor FliA